MLVLIGWVFFRAANLQQSLYVLGQMFSWKHGHPLLTLWQIELALAALLLAILEEIAGWSGRLLRAPAWAYACGIAALLLRERK